MKYFRLIWVNITRKKPRLILTIGSFCTAFFLFGLLIAIHNAFHQGIDIARADRIIVRNQTSLMMWLPYAYKERIKHIKGVEEVTPITWFGGIYQDEKNFFPKFAIEPESYLKVYSEYIVKKGQWEAFSKDRQGCIVGKGLINRFGWKIGDRIPIKGTTFPGNWELNICGVYEGTKEEHDINQLWFQYKYLDENNQYAKGQVTGYAVRLKKSDKALEVITGIDEMFNNSPYETKTEPEALFASGFVKQFGNIKLLLFSVGTIVFFTLLLVSASTMAMSVREKTGELVILKTLGYSKTIILILILCESIAYAFIGGGLGITLIKLFTLSGDPTNGILPNFYLSPLNIIIGLAIAFLIGLISGLFPALRAMSLQIVDGLREI